MAYQSLDWQQTHKNRTDLTGLLTHLTRRTPEMDAIGVLIRILTERTLQGSRKGFIIGNKDVVCFQESPLYSVAENAINHIEDVESGRVSKVRYDPCGLAFHKSSISQLYMNGQLLPDSGVRPVIYERSDLARQFIDPDQYWRIVDLDIRNLYFNGKITDWTYEREWRLAGSLNFRYETVTVLLRNTYQYQDFLNRLERIDNTIIKQLGGIVILETLLY